MFVTLAGNVAYEKKLNKYIIDRCEIFVKNMQTLCELGNIYIFAQDFN